MEEVLTNISWNTINDYKSRGLLISQKHPKYDLWILNYSKDCQFQKAWDEILLQCRGLVTDSDGNIIARCFKKFFNMEEHIANPSLGEIPYGESFEVFEKVDGSLGILFNYNDEWIFASRGSFNSEQAIKGNQILDQYSLLPLDKSFTYLFEIIYPKNRIVVNYGDVEKLVMLGAIHTKTGCEMSHSELINNYDIYRDNIVVRKYDGINDISSIRKELENDTDEGVVIRFTSGFRMKIKWEEYCRLHSILTGVSSKDIWKSIRYGGDLPLEDIPDEFYDWVVNTKKDLFTQLGEMIHLINTEYKMVCDKMEIPFPYNMRKNVDRNAFVKKAFEVCKYPHYVIAKYDKKDITDKLLEKIEPEYAQPFRTNGEN